MDFFDAVKNFKKVLDFFQKIRNLLAFGVGGFFAAASLKAASNSTVSKAEAVELCKKWLSDAYEGVKPDALAVDEAERELALHHGFSRADYEYEIEIFYNGVEYEFRVDSSTGELKLVDRD